MNAILNRSQNPNAPTACEMPAPPSEVDAQVIAMAETASDLSRAVDALEQKLAKVTSPTPASAQGSGKNPSPNAMCPLANGLFEIHQNARQSVDRIRNILGALAL